MSAQRRRNLHEEEEEHTNHERWLVTYADMVTLLMVLFIVMFAMSQVDERKFMELKNGLAAGFANSKSVLPGADSLLEESGTAPIAPIAPDHRVEKITSETTGSRDVPADANTVHEQQAKNEVARLGAIASEVHGALKGKGLKGDVRTSVTDQGLVISLVSKHVTFQANLATLTPRGAAVVDALAPVLAKLTENIEVSGNTNQVPVKPKYYATDWDLSAARAVTVLRRLNEVNGLPADRLSVAAYGNTRPLEDPSIPGSQAINKRVDLIVLSSADAQTRELLEQYADQDLTRGGVSAGKTADDGSSSSDSSDETSKSTAGATTTTSRETGGHS